MPVTAATHIRQATPADATSVAEMVREIAAHENQSEHLHVNDDTWHHLLERPEVTVLIAERDGRTVGYVSAVRQLHLWTGGDVLALDDLYIRPGERNGGIGRQLMLALAQLAETDRLLIRWGVETDNTDAQRFYERLGARLRLKVLAAWSPEQYRSLLAQDTWRHDRDVVEGSDARVPGWRQSLWSRRPPAAAAWRCADLAAAAARADGPVRPHGRAPPCP